VTSGHATSDGTARFVSRFEAQKAAGFYRLAAGLHVSSLGLGTYLGGLDEETDRGYQEAATAAARSGINFFDTAINYRHQRSERCIGTALHQLFNASELQRDEVVVCTKAGFLTPHAVPSFLKPEQVVGGMHSMDPEFLAHQADRSRANLLLDSIDVFYLHNPETQLRFVPRAEFEARIRAAFARLEQLVSDRKICYYGTATWEGYRKPGTLSLARLTELAEQEGGAEHHFRFIQLPFNLAMTEGLSVLEAASQLGVVVVASATLMQSRLSQDAQRAIQFTRSTPGITVALVGMSKPAHVAENVAVP
jgi:aryl-alcohol dehydrogenase-like predicted oxidoreductase